MMAESALAEAVPVAANASGVARSGGRHIVRFGVGGPVLDLRNDVLGRVSRRRDVRLRTRLSGHAIEEFKAVAAIASYEDEGLAFDPLHAPATRTPAQPTSQIRRSRAALVRRPCSAWSMP